MDIVVSVIIPSYNSGNYISQTIQSVIDQTYKSIEIIVVDDGSKDDTLNQAHKFQGVSILSNPKKGACAARNFGYSKSTGDFVQFLDADDLLAPDKIEKQLQALFARKNYQDLLIHSKWGRFRDNEDVYFWGPHESISKDLKPADWLIANQMSMTGCWLTPRGLIERGGLWDETLRRNQDGEFFSRLMLHASEVLFCEEAKVYYRSGNTGSISNTVARPAMESLLKSLQLIEHYIFSLERSSRARFSVADRYQDFVYANYIANPDLALFAEGKVKELGGSSLKLPGGRGLKFLAVALGWKNALRIKKLMVSGAQHS